jgi:molybdopterin converting factor small subunit
MNARTHTLTVRLYANLKEKAGTDCLTLVAPITCTVDELKAKLKHDYPAIAFHLNKVVMTVNGGQIFISDEVLPLNAEVTILPPFGGG